MIKQVIIGSTVLDSAIHPTGTFMTNVPLGITFSLEIIKPLKSKAVLAATADHPEDDLAGEDKVVNKAGVSFICSTEQGTYRYLNYDFHRFHHEGYGFQEYFRRITDLEAHLATSFRVVACVPFLNKEGKPFYPPFAREGYEAYEEAIRIAKE